MVRAQIYLTVREQSELRCLASLFGRSQSELIRDALNRFIEEARVNNRESVLRAAAGLWADAEDRPDFAELRSEADRIKPHLH